MPGGRQLTFAARPHIEEKLRHLIALEAECCVFLKMRLNSTADNVSLTITGLPEAHAQLRDIFAATA